MKRSKWHLGIRSRRGPPEIMSEVFSALVGLKMQWKLIDDSPYHIKVKHSPPNSTPVIFFIFLIFFFFLFFLK